MAQVADGGEGFAARMRCLMRQRPALALGAVLALGLLAGAAGLGAIGALQAGSAGGVEIVPGDAALAESGRTDADAVGGATADESAGEEAPERVVVDVAGAVAEPRVVELDAGSRVQDAIEAAGGLAEDADAAGINRAATVADGQQVYVPRKGEAAGARGSTAGDAGEGSASPADGGAAGASAGAVNINTATVEELDALPGVGPATAQAIVEDREANGPFAAPEDIMRVSGIGEKKFEKMKGSLRV